MFVTRIGILTLLFVCSWPASLPAQSADDTVQVPAGLLEVLGVPVEASRPFAMLRAIRLLYSSPRRDQASRARADFEQLLSVFERLEPWLGNPGARGLSLSMATTADRELFRAALETLGLRVREQQRSYSVSAQDGPAAAGVRALLLRVGIDTGVIQERLNAGDAVHIAPPMIGLPLPLPFETWSADVFASRITPDMLFNAILRSRDASLLYYGVQSMTPETRVYLRKASELVRWLYGRAPIVAAFGAAFRVGGDGRVQLPGGAAAEELWESIAAADVTQPAQFARALFGRDGGRLAYFVETLWALDDVHARFALGLSLEPRLREERFHALYSVFAQMDSTWSPASVPFMRPSYDAGLLLANLQLDESGSMALPHRRLWERGVAGMDVPAAGDRQMLQPGDGSADAAFLAGLLAGKLPRERRVVIERVAFGQRNFAGSADDEMPDVLVALRAYGRFPAAMLGLERIGIREPAHFAQAARRALALEGMDGASAIPLLAQFQGSFALLERLARTGAVGPPILERLAASLIAIDLHDGRYRGAIAEWVRSHLIASLAATASQGAEARLLDALADPTPPGRRTFSWEGQEYVLDAERLRRELGVFRARQKGNTLDALLALYADVAALIDPAVTLDGVKLRTASIKAGAANLSPARAWPDAPDQVPAIDRIFERAVKDLDGIRTNADLRKAPRVAGPLIDALDYLLGETLVALAYAASQGDAARGPAAAIDISHRHVFGTTVSLSEDRRLIPWRRPQRGTAPGAGDAVTGSLLGLDLALAKTRLRRMAADAFPAAPTVTANDAGTMTDTVALLNPRLLDDMRGAHIAEAVQGGRRRVEQTAGESAALEALAVEARITPVRRSLLAWTARHASPDVVNLFSTGELFRLGGGQHAAVDEWGTSHESLTGCFCLRFPDSAAWELGVGRPDTGQAAARAAELNLRVAMLLADLRVPAPLFPGVMAFATQDYIDSVSFVHADDWAAIAGAATAISRERIEDYVSAVVAIGPVRPAEAAGAR